MSAAFKSDFVKHIIPCISIAHANTTISHQMIWGFFCWPDSSDQLRLHGDRTKRQDEVWLFLPCGTPGHLSGSGHGGHRAALRLDLRLHCGRRRQLRREGNLHVSQVGRKVRWEFDVLNFDSHTMIIEIWDLGFPLTSHLLHSVHMTFGTLYLRARNPCSEYALYIHILLLYLKLGKTFLETVDRQFIRNSCNLAVYLSIVVCKLNLKVAGEKSNVNTVWCITYTYYNLSGGNYL